MFLWAFKAFLTLVIKIKNFPTPMKQHFPFAKGFSGHMETLVEPRNKDNTIFKHSGSINFTKFRLPLLNLKFTYKNITI